MTTELAYLRSTGTSVDCDTFSNVVFTSPISHGSPFTGCTSNQAIAYVELTTTIGATSTLLKPSYQSLLISCLSFAKTHLQSYRELPPEYPDNELTVTQLAVEVAMVQMAIAMAPAVDPNIGGDVFVQINPVYANSTAKIIANAVRLKWLFDFFSFFSSHEVAFAQTHQPHLGNGNTNGNDNDKAKVSFCVKIPTNYPGMVAARELRLKYGIRCLATVGVSLEQVRLARELGECEYVTIYVNELGVHFDGEEKEILARRREKAGVGSDGQKDLVDAMEVVRDGQEWLHKNGGVSGGTKMVPASFTSTKECLQLAGVSHITIPPTLLARLANTPYSPETAPDSYLLSPESQSSIEIGSSSYLGDGGAAVFEKDFKKARGGRAPEMFDEAVRIFTGYQTKLEGLVAKAQVN